MDDSARGETSAEMVALATLLFGLVFLIVGVGSWWSSAQTALVASARAARTVASDASTARSVSHGLDEAERTVRDLGGHLAAAPQVEVTRRTVTVRVTVRVGSPGGFLPDVVSRATTLPREEFVNESDR